MTKVLMYQVYVGCLNFEVKVDTIKQVFLPVDIRLIWTKIIRIPRFNYPK